MSLTLPTAYSASSKLSNIQENWIAQLFHQESFLSFDGTDDYIGLGSTTSASAMSITDSLTVAFWVNFPTADVNEFIFSNNSQASDYSGFFIYKDSNNIISIGWGDGSGTTSGDRETMLGSTALAINTWYFVVITTDFSLTTTNTIIRVNNSAETIVNSGTSGATNPVYESGTAYFGRRGNTYGEIKIRNFGIWSGELNSANLTALYNGGNYFTFHEDSGNYTQSSTLKGYWEFNNGENTIQDKSGNGANGTISGSVYGGFTPIALADTTIDDVFYYGTITNKPSIRSSINLSNSTAKTGNISLNVVNFQFKGDDFSAELFLGTRKYINRDVKIYSQLNGDTTLANCLQIYQGRLIDISHDDSSITLQLTEQRPWDFITIPQDKADTQVYEPIAYGDFTKNTEGTTTSFLSSKSLFPCSNVNYGINGHVYFVYPKVYGSGAKPHFYDSNIDQFIPFTDANDNTSTALSVNTVGVPIDMERGYFLIRPYSPSGYTNSSNAVDTDATSYASGESTPETATSGQTEEIDTLSIDLPTVDGDLTELYVYVKAELTHTDTSGVTASYLRVGKDSSNLALISKTSGGSGVVNTSGYTINGVSGYSRVDALGATTINVNLRTTALEITGPGAADGVAVGAVKVYDIVLQIKVANDTTNEKTASMDKLSKLKTVYTGGDGLTESWSGSSGAIEHGHEAHRDLLIRFTGYTTTDPENWSALHTDRHINTWKIRWWELEPVDLKKILEQLQYEFGFIFKFRADGTGSVIHILQTSELSATQTFTKEDIANLKINNSSLSDLLTKMEINYEKHPTGSRYLSSVTSANTTTRSNYNIQAKENIKNVNLDMNVGTPNTSGQTDGNTDFYSYYDNIFGDIKKIISCDIVNPAKGYSLETGDIVQFSNTAGEMPIEPFGDNWADFYMITDLVRGLGTVKITAREVG
jgi:hypothetical protein